MTEIKSFTPARELAATNQAHFPNESPEYRAARNALLAEADRATPPNPLERVAEQRRALPPGGEIPQDFAFTSESGPVRLSQASSTAQMVPQKTRS